MRYTLIGAAYCRQELLQGHLEQSVGASCRWPAPGSTDRSKGTAVPGKTGDGVTEVDAQPVTIIGVTSMSVSTL